MGRRADISFKRHPFLPEPPKFAPVAPRHRLTIRSIDPDPRANAIVTAADHLGIGLEQPELVEIADLVFVEGELGADDLNKLHGFLVDPLLQMGSWHEPTTPGVEITYLPGVTDNAAATLLHGADQLGIGVVGAATGRRLELGDAIDHTHVEDLVRRLVANPVIERWEHGAIQPTFHAGGASTGTATTVALSGKTLEELVAIGTERALALDPEELVVVQRHFGEVGREPTDVELETLAQTWSEHCAHKTFRAAIATDDGEDRSPLITMLRECT